METNKEFEKAGYDAYLRVLVDTGRTPKFGDCPVLSMPISDERKAFMRGWNKARDEL